MEVVVMPKLGLTMEEGTITRWLKREGEKIEKGEILLEVETDKSLNEVESTVTGTVGKILIGESESAEVSQVIGYILEAGEEAPREWPIERDQYKKEEPALSSVRTEHKASPVVVRMAREQGIDIQNIVGTGEGGFITKEDIQNHIRQPPTAEKAGRLPRRASPRAMRLAQEKGIPLERIQGSGPRGRITERDVIKLIETQDLIRPSRIQQITADRLSKSFSSVPHFYLKVDIGANEITCWRDRLLPELEKEIGVRLTFTDLVFFLVAKTLKNHPRVNAAWEDGFIRINDNINIGLAIEVEDGLVVPVVKNADTMTIEEIVQVRTDLVERAHEGKLSLSDIEGGTFTITNLGMFGIDEFAAIINPPQSAILAVGSIEERVRAKDGRMVVELTVTFTLSIDHRVLDGAVGARFLQELKAAIEQPEDVIEKNL